MVETGFSLGLESRSLTSLDSSDGWSLAESSASVPACTLISLSIATDCSIIAIFDPVFTLSPTFTNSSLRTPDLGEGTSIAALSDSKVINKSSTPS